MKKSSLVAMMLGTISLMFFALGMCMVLLPEWNAFKPGIAFGSAGLVLGLITLFVWRKMEHKAPVKFNGRIVLLVLVAIIGSLVLGLGMCFCMIWGNIILGTIIGTVGILVLLSLIPMVKGIK